MGSGWLSRTLLQKFVIIVGKITQSRKYDMTFIQNYLSQFNLDSILTTVFNKLLSLILLYIVF